MVCLFMARDRFEEQPEVVREEVSVCKCGPAGEGGRDLNCKKHGNKQ